MLTYDSNSAFRRRGGGDGGLSPSSSFSLLEREDQQKRKEKKRKYKNKKESGNMQSPLPKEKGTVIYGVCVGVESSKGGGGGRKGACLCWSHDMMSDDAEVIMTTEWMELLSVSARMLVSVSLSLFLDLLFSFSVWECIYKCTFYVCCFFFLYGGPLKGNEKKKMLSGFAKSAPLFLSFFVLLF